MPEPRHSRGLRSPFFDGIGTPIPHCSKEANPAREFPARGNGLFSRSPEEGETSMALTKQVAQKIVDAVADDSECWRVIEPPASRDPKVRAMTRVLEYTETAGSFRNVLLMAMGKEPGDPTFDRLICQGVQVVTQKAILKWMRANRLPEVRSCAGAHRITGIFRVHHQATWVRMRDDAEYVFDWHATLRVRNPVISKLPDWLVARNGLLFEQFEGF
jgi:hypothetical protein